MCGHHLVVLNQDYALSVTRGKRLGLIQAINLAWLGVQLVSESAWSIELDKNDVVISGDSAGFIPVTVNGTEVSLYRPELVRAMYGAVARSTSDLYPALTRVSLNQVLSERCDLVLAIDDKNKNPVFIPVSKLDTVVSIFKSILAALCQIWPIKAELRLQIDADLGTIEQLRLK